MSQKITWYVLIPVAIITLLSGIGAWYDATQIAADARQAAQAAQAAEETSNLAWWMMMIIPVIIAVAWARIRQLKKKLAIAAHLPQTEVPQTETPKKLKKGVKATEA